MSIITAWIVVETETPVDLSLSFRLVERHVGVNIS